MCSDAEVWSGKSRPFWADFFRTTPFTFRNRDLRNALYEYFCDGHLWLVQTKMQLHGTIFSTGTLWPSCQKPPVVYIYAPCRNFAVHVRASHLWIDCKFVVTEVWSGKSWPFWADFFRTTPFTSWNRDLRNALCFIVAKMTPPGR